MSRIGILLNTFKKKRKLKSDNVNISPLAVFDGDCEFEDHIHVDRLSILHNCKIGRYTYITTGCEISNCKIGRFCSVAGGVKIGLGKHPVDHVSTSPVFYSSNNRLRSCFYEDSSVEEKSDVCIGNDVWIGTNAIIVNDVKIGDGAVIAAGAVVTKDVPPYSIVGGVPAKVIRSRFPEETVEKLLELKWWNSDDEQLKKMAADFSDVEKFLKSKECKK